MVVYLPEKLLGVIRGKLHVPIVMIPNMLLGALLIAHTLSEGVSAWHAPIAG